MAIARKPKPCRICGRDDQPLFSKGRCKGCAQVEYAQTTKANRKSNQVKKSIDRRKRKKTVTSLKKKLWKIFSKYIRIKHADAHTGLVRCWTCDVEKHWKEMQCGHGISRRYNSTLFHEKNNHPQCAKCNVLNSGEQYVYSKKVDEKYGNGTFEELFQLSRETKHFTTYELECMIKKYETLLVELQQNKNINT